MKVPISWLKDYIDLDGLAIEEIARMLTLAGLEVDEIKYAGLPMPIYQEGEPHEFKTSGMPTGASSSRMMMPSCSSEMPSSFSEATIEYDSMPRILARLRVVSTNPSA